MGRHVTVSGQRILVTGFTGRLGGAFAAYLAADNEVTGVALAATGEELDRWRARGIDPYVVDLASDDYGPLPRDFDYVVHTAAAVYHADFAAGMRANAEAPYRAVETDLIGGSRLLGHYTGTKAAGEGAVRAMARVLNLGPPRWRAQRGAAHQHHRPRRRRLARRPAAHGGVLGPAHPRGGVPPLTPAALVGPRSTPVSPERGALTPCRQPGRRCPANRTTVLELVQMY
jgi:hypothetical protein